MVDENPNGRELENSHPLDVGTRKTKLTRDTDNKVRDGHVPEIALNVCLGNYPKELITTQACREVHGSGGTALVERVLIYLVAHYNVDKKTIECSQTQLALNCNRDRGVINKCVRVLKDVGLLVDVGKGLGGTRKYRIPLIERYVWGDPVVQDVVEPVVQGVVQGVGISTHIQNSTSTQQHTYDEQALNDHYREWYDIALAVVNAPKPEYTKTVAMEFRRVMQYAHAWQEQPELYGKELETLRGTRTEAGGIVQAMKELEYKEPKQARQPCPTDKCDLVWHENPITGEMTLCPYRGK